MEEAMTSPLRSPLPLAEDPPPNSDESSLSPQASALSSKAAIRTPGEAQDEATAAENSRVVSWILQRRWRAEAVWRSAVASRVAAAVLCLVSFSVMAADKDRGWAADSFDRYKEYRYYVSVNVIGFVYAGFQAYAEVHRRINNNHFIRRPLVNFFDFVMDQILAYLLISASSSATAHNNYWVTNWGTDPFPNMISGAVAVSFLAFFAFALSSFFSAYNLFKRTI